MKATIIFLTLLIVSIASMFYFYHMAVHFYHQLEALPLGVESVFEERAAETAEMERFQLGVDVSVVVALASAIGLGVAWIRGKIKKWRALP